MEVGFRIFFRLGVVLLLTFVAFRNLRGFPQETEAVARVMGGRAGGYRSYNSLYRGRTIYRPFGRSSRNKGYDEPVDKQRLYYETKMAEWREKQKLLQANATTTSGHNDTEHTQPDFHDNSEEEEEDEDEDESEEYDYEESQSQQSPTPLPTTEPTTLETSIAPDGENSTDLPTTEISPSTSTTTASVTKATPVRRSYGLRYGRVKVETLRN